MRLLLSRHGTSLPPVQPSSPLNVAAILHAVYRQPTPPGDALAERVRARVALLETVTECLRLLTSAPVAALGHGFEQTRKSGEGS
jgi:hypothetical protein